MTTGWKLWQEHIRLTVLDQAEQRDAIRGWLNFMRATGSDPGTIAYLEAWLVRQKWSWGAWLHGRRLCDELAERC